MKMSRKIIILENIRSMQNVGAIFRNADGAGFNEVYLCWYTPHPPRNDISKTALGSQNTVFWEYYSNIWDVLDILGKQWVKIFSLELTPNAKDYREYYKKDVGDFALIVWNEVSGVSEFALKNSQETIMIPMLWKKESLNVSVAAGIAMYAFL